MIKLMLGDCLQILRDIPADSVDAVVTDPPAGIAFMRKSWDNPQNYPISGFGFSDGGKRVPAPTIGRSARNGTCRKCGKRERGYKDVLPCTCSEPDFNEDERRQKDRAYFVDFLTAAMVECFRVAKPGSRALVWAIPRTSHWTGIAIEDAGWIIEDRISHLFGQGFPKAKSRLKPACEDWWLARKPSRNVPPLNIDDCRIECEARPKIEADRRRITGNSWMGGLDGSLCGSKSAGVTSEGRWPANLVLDEQAAAMLDEQSGILTSGKAPDTGFVRNSDKHRNAYGAFEGNREEPTVLIGDSGGASRFFYCAKASPKDRGEDNDHPTVKPHDLMRWLIRLITNPGDVVFDPFMGSGSTGKAATAEGRSFVGIESHEPYFRIAERRIKEAEGRKNVTLAPPLDRPPEPREPCPRSRIARSSSSSQDIPVIRSERQMQLFAPASGMDAGGS